MDAKDIIYNDDIEFANGDLLVDFSDGQHIEHIIIADRGQWRQNPLIGAGCRRQLNGAIDRQAKKQEIKLQLRADNYRSIFVGISSGEELEIEVDAKRLR